MCDKLKSENESEMGFREKLLNDKLEDVKVARQAYHGNVFVGNHCKIVLKNYELLCGVVSDKLDMHVKITKVFGIFSQICPYLFLKSRLLTSDEIATVKELCTQFGQVFPVLFPEVNVTRKIHELVFNVPHFLSRFKTVGMMSEEEGESLHASINCELRNLYSVCDPAEKLALLLKRHELRSKAPKSLLKRQPRLCSTCKDSNQVRIFLRGGGERWEASLSKV